MNVIELKDVTKVYGFGEATTVALDEISLNVKDGEFVAVMGPSGCGKSTLMNIIGMLDRPTHGTYLLDGKNISKYGQNRRAKLRRKKIGFIFQSFNLLPKLTALENVALPLTYSGYSHVKRLETAAEYMKKVDLETKQYYMPSQLSGGQVQRVAVARALVNRPSIVIADEPTGNLDTASSINIMDLLSDIHKAGHTIIMVTHNPELAEYADRIIMMKDGRVDTDSKSKKAKAELSKDTEGQELKTDFNTEEKEENPVKKETSKKKTTTKKKSKASKSKRKQKKEAKKK